MPVQYKPGIIKEHKMVREAIGLFDVSHMGEAIVRGPGALASIQHLITNDVAKLEDGRALYTVMCLPNGGIVDDCIVYRKASDEFLIILNASNRDKDVAWLREHATDCAVEDVSDDTALIAVQGPKAVAMLDGLANTELAEVKRFAFADCSIAGVPVMAARTGYTGEDGFEIACPADRGEELWNSLLEASTPLGGGPVGLGARDTLRLEARLSLYGNDIDETTTPYEAGLGWVVKPAAGEFIGSAELAKQKEAGLSRKLVGFVIEDRKIARPGYSMVDRSVKGSSADPVIGAVTSGTKGISVDGSIGLGYVPKDVATIGGSLTIDVRGTDVAATIVKGPFYKRG